LIHLTDTPKDAVDFIIQRHEESELNGKSN